MRRKMLYPVLVSACVSLAWGCSDSGFESGRTSPGATWPTAAPEEQGFDSARLAQLVEQIHLRGLPVDSLQLVRNGVLILDAYFYPYPDDRAHDVASVTESADLEFADPGEYFPAQTFQATSVVSCN